VARPTTITDEQILAAARQLFLQRGLRASTAELAQLTGVAEGTIFKRFPTKAALFRAAMRIDVQPPEFMVTLQAHAADDPRAVLLEAGTQAIEFFRLLVPLQMINWSSGPTGNSHEHLLAPDSPPLRALKAIAEFFEREMRLKRVRRHDPEIMARVFLGSIQSYVFFEVLLREQNRLPMAPDAYLRGLIKLIWEGAEPEVATAPKTRTRKKPRSDS
jgi:AcrR family transcriptional regulator